MPTVSHDVVQLDLYLLQLLCEDRAPVQDKKPQEHWELPVP